MSILKTVIENQKSIIEAKSSQLTEKRNEMNKMEELSEKQKSEIQCLTREVEERKVDRMFDDLIGAEFESFNKENVKQSKKSATANSYESMEDEDEEVEGRMYLIESKIPKFKLKPIKLKRLKQKVIKDDYDNLLARKDKEIAQLKGKIESFERQIENSNELLTEHDGRVKYWADQFKSKCEELDNTFKDTKINSLVNEIEVLLKSQKQPFSEVDSPSENIMEVNNVDIDNHPATEQMDIEEDVTEDESSLFGKINKEREQVNQLKKDNIMKNDEVLELSQRLHAKDQEFKRLNMEKDGMIYDLTEKLETSENERKKLEAKMCQVLEQQEKDSAEGHENGELKALKDELERKEKVLICKSVEVQEKEREISSVHTIIQDFKAQIEVKDEEIMSQTAKIKSLQLEEVSANNSIKELRGYKETADSLVVVLRDDNASLIAEKKKIQEDSEEIKRYNDELEYDKKLGEKNVEKYLDLVNQQRKKVESLKKLIKDRFNTDIVFHRSGEISVLQL